jgi:DNA-directed RNA polymerase specialized sigma24 family protein
LPRRPNYPARRVKTLVEDYSTLRYLKDTKPGRSLDTLCQLVDLDVAVSNLGPIEYVSILLCGLIGLTQEEAAETLGVRQSTVSRRYDRALDVLRAAMNGEDEPA